MSVKQELTDVQKQIDQVMGEVRTGVVDFSFGELISLHQNDELVIHPEYQRLFRWSNVQRSRFIETVLLELPYPPIFLIELASGQLELIDGLQRLCSVMQFIDYTQLATVNEPLHLEGCDLLQELNDKAYLDLPLPTRLDLKRSMVRTIVIKRQSSSKLRYEMFKRLNTGGSEISPQEIRNCTARMLGDEGVRFYEFLKDCASNPDFVTCTQTLADSERERKQDEELVLRFLTLKNSQDSYRGNVRDWLDKYMEDTVKSGQFDFESESECFNSVFDLLGKKLGEGAFVNYRGDRQIGGLKPAYFEAVTMGFVHNLDKLRAIPESAIRQAIAQTVQSQEFRQCTGPGANNKEKLRGRIAVIKSALEQIT